MRRAALPLLLLSLSGCLDSLFESLPQEPPFPTGASFAYTATSFRFDTMLVGTITVLPADSGRFTGTWVLSWAPGVDSSSWSGLLAGEGSVTGFIRGTNASISLMHADTLRRIVMYAGADSAGWTGTWNYYDSLVARRGGRFTARLIP